MDRNEALEALPAPYGRALTLDAIATLLEVGRAKVAALLDADADDENR